MNSQALNEHADWLDKGEFGDRGFDMGDAGCCALRHASFREMKRTGKPATHVLLGDLSARMFGIIDPDDFAFAFGAQWGTDHHAAAYRLRDLARNKKAPPRELWDRYRKAPAQTPVREALVPQESLC